MATANSSDVQSVRELIVHGVTQWLSDITEPASNPTDIWTWNKTQVSTFWTVIVIGVEILSFLVLVSFQGFDFLPAL